MKQIQPILMCALLIVAMPVFAQTNILVTNPAADQVLRGQYNPADYAATRVVNHPDSISLGLLREVSPDSLHRYVETLVGFGTRNTGSDTLSANRGIGAARRWVFSRFAEFSARNDNRLLPAYLQFDRDICDVGQHRNVFAVLPGTSSSDNSVIIVEAHMDSRCENVCDTACPAPGAEDNAAGTALVIELARVMSRYSFNHTLVFLATISEEQGLYGAKAFADYLKQEGIPVKAVMNNDVVGGVICGKTASQPGCSGEGSIDSTQVRLFSLGGLNSPHKGLVRYLKLQYKEMILPHAQVPMTLTIMTPEDRNGRSGDHVPFRQQGFTAMRFTSANEHGDSRINLPGYSDRQHTTSDVLGVDTDNDSVIDSFFVDFNYLARNAVINGNGAGMAAISPVTPLGFTMTKDWQEHLIVEIDDPHDYLHYRVGVRTTSNDWDTVYTFVGSKTCTLALAPFSSNYIISVASVDARGVESFFTQEQIEKVTGVEELGAQPQPFELMQNRPNPFDEATIISVVVSKAPAHKNAFILIRDLATGREIKRLPLQLKEGVNEVLYEHGYHMSGVMTYTLMVDGKAIDTKTMVFAN
jgi:hypothetical protein